MEENHQILTSKKMEQSKLFAKSNQMTIKNFLSVDSLISLLLIDYLLQLHKWLFIRKPRQNNVYLRQNILLFASI